MHGLAGYTEALTHVEVVARAMRDAKAAGRVLVSTAVAARVLGVTPQAIGQRAARPRFNLVADGKERPMYEASCLPGVADAPEAWEHAYTFGFEGGGPGVWVILSDNRELREAEMTGSFAGGG